jgi:hypothetical protein
MSATDSKAINKKALGYGRDRGIGGRFKETGGNNSFKKPRLTGDCEDMKECVFDCEDDKKENVFDLNMKELSNYAATMYEKGAIIMTMSDEMIELEIMKPIPFTGTDPIEIEIYKLRNAQYILIINRNLKMNAKILQCNFGSMH